MTTGVIIGDDGQIYSFSLSLVRSQVPCCLVAGHPQSNWVVSPMLQCAFAPPVYKASVMIDPIVHVVFGQLVVLMIYIWG